MLRKILSKTYLYYSVNIYPTIEFNNFTFLHPIQFHGRQAASAMWSVEKILWLEYFFMKDIQMKFYLEFFGIFPDRKTIRRNRLDSMK